MFEKLGSIHPLLPHVAGVLALLAGAVIIDLIAKHLLVGTVRRKLIDRLCPLVGQSDPVVLASEYQSCSRRRKRCPVYFCSGNVIQAYWDCRPPKVDYWRSLPSGCSSTVEHQLPKFTTCLLPESRRSMSKCGWPLLAGSRLSPMIRMSGWYAFVSSLSSDRLFEDCY